MPRHGSTNKAIALSLLILGPPNLAQLVHSLHPLNLLLRQLATVPLATTARRLTNPRTRPLCILSILVQHLLATAVLDGHERFGSASVVEPLLYKGGIEALSFNGLLDFRNVLVFLVGSPVLFE